MKNCFVCAGVLVVTFTATTSHAALIEMTASGAINSSNMDAFGVGQIMTVTWVYESTGSPQFISNQQAFYVDHWRSIQVTSGGYNSSYNGTFGQINKYDNLSNTDGIQFQVAANQATYQFTNPKPQAVQLASVFSNGQTMGFTNMFINFGSSSNQVWNNYNLPDSYDFNQFDATRNMLFSFTGGSFGVGITSLTWQVVPTPGAAALLVLGLFGGSRRRR